MVTLRVENPGALTTVQDLGRYGHERFGVPVSGAMDAFALRAANALVGNGPNAAGLEMAFDGAAVRATEDCVVAVAAPHDGSVRVNGRALPAWTALFVRAGQTVEVTKASGYVYLAVSGGIEVPLVLGSRSTYLRGGFGGLEGRALRAGDALPTGPARSPFPLAGRALPAAHRPPYREQPELEVLLGPQLDHFDDEARAAFLNAPFTVSNDSDRMGYRLTGPAIAPQRADLISEPMPLGAVQVPANGQPIVMMADRPTTGGYPRIATVIRADVPLLAQCPPGAATRFRGTTVEAAQQKHRAQLAALKMIERPDEAESFI
jgi:antagonist of KipI